MRINRIIKEITIAVGVTAGVIAVGFIVLLGAGPYLRQPKAFDNFCVLDRVLVFERSAIGQSANSQLMQLKLRYQDELNREKATIDQTGIDGSAADHMAQLVRRVQIENFKLDAVRRRARALVIQKIAPEITRQAAAYRCFTVLDRSTVVDQGHAVDITSELVNSVDKNVPPLPSGTLENMTH